jgi:hypothetical protein
MKRIFWGLAPAACLTFCALAYAQGSWKLSINGAAVSTNVRTIGGVTYVPINDVAKALKMKATISGRAITLKPAGGTFQIANKLQGNQGEELFSGKWGFSVISVQRTSSYKAKYLNSYNREDTYDGMGSDVVVVACRLKNGTKTKQEFAFSVRDYGMNTALTDMDAGTYQPTGYDVFADEPSPLGKYALPGSAIPFNIVFRVPKDTKLKDLVFSVVLYGERGDNKSTDFRVALKDPGPTPQ